MPIDYSKIITKEDFMKIKKQGEAAVTEFYSDVNKATLFYTNYLSGCYHPNILAEIKEARAKEVAYLGMQTVDKDPIFKGLVASTIIYNSKEQFIRTLIKNKVSYYDLYNVSRLISKMSTLSKIAKDLETDSDINLVNKKVSQVYGYIIKYFRHKDIELIITKINEIVVFDEKLYKQLEREPIAPTENPLTR